VHRVDDRDLGPAGPLTQEVAATWSRRVRENDDP
jgi:hypothetical protein